ncbi:DUF1289 domain-containing protein [Inhella gelatinilytica]|uniref:DUF1289 domain-containing protein n=1 Tax=Inhella gelatinilytica TaxID=2795030 RepID=A0A931IYB8_9BURK|nr:DUF1289 domain-containing protein [Inhella gelatinilytica]MBH9552853.1 DUF1289 domain-containing protein [Inhella gelatinilytica]
MPFEAPLPSPCTKVCKLDASGQFCLGCARTRDEIGAWSSLGRAQQAEVWRALPERARTWGVALAPLPPELKL